MISSLFLFLLFNWIFISSNNPNLTNDQNIELNCDFKDLNPYTFVSAKFKIEFEINRLKLLKSAMG